MSDSRLFVFDIPAKQQRRFLRKMGWTDAQTMACSEPDGTVHYYFREPPERIDGLDERDVNLGFPYRYFDGTATEDADSDFGRLPCDILLLDTMRRCPEPAARCLRRGTEPHNHLCVPHFTSVVEDIAATVPEGQA